MGKHVISNLNADDFAFKIATETGVILDIRTEEEYQEGHIAGAILIDYYSDNFEDKISKLNKDIPYFIYCRSGHRSADAVQLMKDAGIQKIYHLDGGVIAWLNAGKEVVK